MTENAGGQSVTRSTAGLIILHLNAPDELREWLFGGHARDVVDSVPGVVADRTYEVLNPLEPAQARLVTILESEDVLATWKYRQTAEALAAKSDADARGVRDRREYVVRLINEVSGR